jgi:hypothetical protein
LSRAGDSRERLLPDTEKSSGTSEPMDASSSESASMGLSAEPEGLDCELGLVLGPGVCCCVVGSDAASDLGSGLCCCVAGCGLGIGAAGGCCVVGSGANWELEAGL